MLSLKQLIGAPVSAKDGDVGALRDAYVRVDDWVVHTLVVEPTEMERTIPVALGPETVLGVDPKAGRIELELTLAQVQDAPSVDLRRPPASPARGGAEGAEDADGQGDMPEEWPPSSPSYSPSAAWGRPATIGDVVLGSSEESSMSGAPQDEEDEDDTGAERVRETSPEGPGKVDEPGSDSASRMIGDRVLATDGEIGTLDDLLVDPGSWHVDCLVVASAGWVAGTHSFVSSADVDRVDRPAAAVHLRVAGGKVGGDEGCAEEPSPG